MKCTAHSHVYNNKTGNNEKRSLTHQSTSYSVRPVTNSVGLHTVIFNVQPGVYRARLFSVRGAMCDRSHTWKLFNFLYRTPRCVIELKYNHHHHHKHQVLDPLIRSVSTVTAVRANASSVFQLFSFLVVCSGMISKRFGFVAFFASVEATSVCIHLSCLVCL